MLENDERLKNIKIRIYRTNQKVEQRKLEINSKKFASIAIDLQFDPINEIIEKIEFFDGIGYGYMVDKDFNVIAHKTQKSLIGKNLIDINQQIFNPMIEL